MAPTNHPTEAFETYALSLDEADPTSRLVIAVPNRLPQMLCAERDWELSPRGWAQPPEGSWQEELLSRSLPIKEIFIGSTILRGLNDLDPQIASLRLGYLAALAGRPHINMRVVRRSAEILPKGFGFLVRGEPHAAQFGGGIWTTDGAGLLQPSSQPAAPRFFARKLAQLNGSTDTIAANTTPGVLDWGQYAASNGRDMYTNFLVKYAL